MIKFPELNHEIAQEILNKPVPDEVQEYYHTDYHITLEQSTDYLKNGYAKLTGVLEGPALDYTRKLIGSAVLLRKESDHRTLAEKSQYEQSFLQCGYLCWDFEPVRTFVFGSRFAGIARDLMATDGVRLWHDQALYKESGGRVTDMHQDISYWPINTADSITMWLALVDVPVHKGNLYFIPQSHNSGINEYVDIFKNPHVPNALVKSKQIDVPLNAGDATFHSGRTYHGARANTSDGLREAMTIIYIADGTRFDATDERNATHTSCQGLNHGDIIDTKYTPILK